MAKRLEELISQIQYMGGLESRLAEHLIANDVVPVVRCGDCKHWGRYEPTSVSGRCRFECKMRMEDDFCSYGERKDNE